MSAPTKTRYADLPGRVTLQVSETITVTATGEETYGELKAAVARRLPSAFEVRGGCGRIRKGDPVPGAEGKTYNYDRQAHVVAVAHHPAVKVST